MASRLFQLRTKVSQASKLLRTGSVCGRGLGGALTPSIPVLCPGSSVSPVADSFLSASRVHRLVSIRTYKFDPDRAREDTRHSNLELHAATRAQKEEAAAKKAAEDQKADEERKAAEDKRAEYEQARNKKYDQFMDFLKLDKCLKFVYMVLTLGLTIYYGESYLGYQKREEAHKNGYYVCEKCGDGTSKIRWVRQEESEKQD